MEFGLSSEQTLLQDSVNRFLSEQVPLDQVRQVASGEATSATVWAGLTDLGIPGLLISEANGGLGLSSLDAAIVAELLGYHVTPSPYISSAVIAPITLQAAGKREELLGSVATGETRIGIAFGEGLAARNDAQLSFTDNKLTGKSLFALDSDADYYLVADAKRCIYLVDATAAGLERSNLTTVDKTRSTCELNYSNVAAELISSDEAVFTKAVDAGLVAFAADTLGASQCALDQAVEYAGQREQFNRVIASFQAVKHMCAEMVAALEPCRSMVWYAAHALDELPDEATMMASHTKAHLSEVGQFVTRTSTEVHGGMGFTDLVGLHYWFKRAGLNRQILGSPEVLRERAARVQGLTA
jgi:alkylation response protein AidB-like acyl-CoA dehydrogenase